MRDENKTKPQLSNELTGLRQRIAELEKVEIECLQVEETLRRERDLMGQIMQTSPAGIAVVDRRGQITFANPQAERVLGLTRDKITNLTYNAPEWHITSYN